MGRSPTRLYSKCSDRDLGFSHVCEVGVYRPEHCNVIDFIREGVRTTLVEPEPGAIRAIKEAFGHQKNVTLLPYAVYDYNGKVVLSKAGASTFVSRLSKSPALENDRYQREETKQIEVECRIFSDLDDGTINLLCIDIEGADWYVLKNLKSRPQVISVETHGKFYANPFMMEIGNWMEANGYEAWYKDNSDTVYARRDALKVSPRDRIGLLLKGVHLHIRKLKRIFRFR